MPRYARKRSNSQVYHVMLRGIDRMPIFLADYDRARFLETMGRMKKNREYEIYAYCLMENHIHLLLKELEEPLHETMKRIGVSYAYYFNKKYDRVGHVFQDRYRSETIENDRYLLAAVRYVHNNPVKAGIAAKASDYPWSSYCEYLKLGKARAGVNTQAILRMFSEDEALARTFFEDFSQTKEDERFIDVDDGVEKTGNGPGNVTPIIEEILKGYGYCQNDLVKIKDKKFRNKILTEIKNKTKASNRELSRILGISKDIIFRA